MLIAILSVACLVLATTVVVQGVSHRRETRDLRSVIRSNVEIMSEQAASRSSQATTIHALVHMLPAPVGENDVRARQWMKDVDQAITIVTTAKPV